MRISKRVRCGAFLFLLGGALYCLLEKLWRGRSHWSMFLLGGFCFHLIGLVRRVGCRWRLVYRCSLCSCCITVMEYIGGCLFNLKLKLGVWDYSRMKFNLRGQVCLLYTMLWGVLSAAAMPLFGFCARLLGDRRPLRKR